MVFLFRGAAKEDQKKLIDENLLDAVIGLPEKLFYGTGIPAAVLVFKKDKADSNVLFIDASREYKDGRTRTSSPVENIARIISTYQAREDVDKYAHIAGVDEIRKRLQPQYPRYVDTFEGKEIDLMAVRPSRSS